MGELENQPITNLPVEDDQQENHSEIQLDGVIEDNPEENSLISSTPCTVPSSSDVSDDPAEKSPVEITNSVDLEVVANDSLDTVENSLAAEATDELADNTFLAPISGCTDSVSSQRSEVNGSLFVKQKVLKAPNRQFLSSDVTHVPIQPSDIIEYEWPQKSGERFFIQEQISELLGISSFKRKYPEMHRRTIEPAERDMLLKEKKVQIALTAHHLTALHAVDVYELMSSEYPEIYSSYQKACNERVRQAMLEKQKEFEAIKTDAKKLAELRQKAIQSSFTFNSDLQAVRKAERTQYWELNTNIIHSPLNKWMRVAKEYTKPSIYPVYLVPGQYTDYYKKFTSTELRSLPFNTVLNTRRLFPPKRDLSPPSIKLTEEELSGPKETTESTILDQKDAKEDFKNTIMARECDSPKSLQRPLPPKMRKIGGDNGFASKKNSTFSSFPRPLQITSASSSFSSNIPIASVKLSTPNCSICQLPDAGLFQGKSAMVRCSSCQQRMHSSCIDMPQSMVDMIRQYDWLCIDCKRCYVCQQPDQEAAMMCCDLCDRGYHTFCIGLDQPPNGTWHCPKCKESNHNSSTTIEIKSEVNLSQKWNFTNQMASGSDPHANQPNVSTQIKIEKKPKIERKRGRPRKKVSEDVPAGE
ncbi:unnamed protein product [Meloidogyne enterolobii]|uniref:Uncharacterized protein n=2 Tax=Meloidogyne enterolobii TaxID=390850 RepID=A0ACB0Y0F1_MELEN